MTREELFDNIKSKESFLCIGLDTDVSRIPAHLNSSKDPIFEFNKYIIDATINSCIAYKPNLAFYEAMGPAGLESLEKTMEFIPGEVFTIADAKRGDIGNTSALYARAFFERMNFDSITISPYMGHDAILPYLEYNDKWVIVLALTSNPGSSDFQHLDIAGNHSDIFNIEEMEFFEYVVKRVAGLGTPDNLMFVVGATKSSYMKRLRKRVPDNFFLVPGVGAQGGDLEDVAANAMNNMCGIIVNASRTIIYASNGLDFADAAARAALELQNKMKEMLDKYL